MAKTYLVEVVGPLARRPAARCARGSGWRTARPGRTSFKLVAALGKTALVEITVHEGRKHIVRRMIEEVGHPVTRLIRTEVGPIKLGDLKPGRWRHLTRAEVADLFAAVAAVPDRAAGDRRGPDAAEWDDDPDGDE